MRRHGPCHRTVGSNFLSSSPELSLRSDRLSLLSDRLQILDSSACHRMKAFEALSPVRLHEYSLRPYSLACGLLRSKCPRKQHSMKPFATSSAKARAAVSFEQPTASAASRAESAMRPLLPPW
jgi:hypothetical protein